jgi:hypothetical protein
VEVIVIPRAAAPPDDVNVDRAIVDYDGAVRRPHRPVTGPVRAVKDAATTTDDGRSPPTDSRPVGAVLAADRRPVAPAATRPVGQSGPVAPADARVVGQAGAIPPADVGPKRSLPRLAPDLDSNPSPRSQGPTPNFSSSGWFLKAAIDAPVSKCTGKKVRDNRGSPGGGTRNQRLANRYGPEASGQWRVRSY